MRNGLGMAFRIMPWAVKYKSWRLWLTGVRVQICLFPMLIDVACGRFFADGRYQTRDLASYNSSIVTALTAAGLDQDGRKEVIYGLGNGELIIIRR